MQLNKSEVILAPKSVPPAMQTNITDGNLAPKRPLLLRQNVSTALHKTNAVVQQ
jgi:hypothetical protein